MSKYSRYYQFIHALAEKMEVNARIIDRCITKAIRENLLTVKDLSEMVDDEIGFNTIFQIWVLLDYPVR